MHKTKYTYFLNIFKGISTIFCHLYCFWIYKKPRELSFPGSSVLCLRGGKKYSNTLQTRGSKLAKFSNLGFLSLLYTSKLAVLLLRTQICNFCYFLSPKNREFVGITVLLTMYNNRTITVTPDKNKVKLFDYFSNSFYRKKPNFKMPQFSFLRPLSKLFLDN